MSTYSEYLTFHIYEQSCLIEKFKTKNDHDCNFFFVIVLIIKSLIQRKFDLFNFVPRTNRIPPSIIPCAMRPYTCIYILRTPRYLEPAGYHFITYIIHKCANDIIDQ